MKSFIVLLLALLLHKSCLTLAGQENRCNECERLFYELRFNLSMPCQRRGDTSQVPQLACFHHPDKSDPFNRTFDIESESVSFIRSLHLLELDSVYNVQAQSTFDGSWTSGYSLLYESAVPHISKGLHVMATGILARDSQEETLRSWSLHLGETCVKDHIRESVGWAELVIACVRKSSETSPPTYAPASRSKRQSMAMKRRRREV